MLWRVNLVTIALTLCCMTCALEMIDSYNSSSQVNDTNALARIAVENLRGSKQLELNRRGSNTALQPTMKIQYSSLACLGNCFIPSLCGCESSTHKSSSYGNKRCDQSRRMKQKMDGMMMALLMAYKMKFVALIPTLVGGTILLVSTAALAGFFFSLFAAVLGLKIH